MLRMKIISAGLASLVLTMFGPVLLSAQTNILPTTGKVGIGTTSPQYTLDVNGDLNLSGSYRYQGVPLIQAQPSLYNYFFAGAGNLSGTGCCNVALGAGALINISTGANNVAIGDSALGANTTGGGNVAVGTYALQHNTMAQYSVALGFGSLGNSTTGAYNSGVGAGSLSQLTTGFANSALGQNALWTLTTGYLNNAVGADALTFLQAGSNDNAFGYSALVNLETGVDDVAVGDGAGDDASNGSGGTVANVSGYQNTYLGASTMSLASGDNNETVIGAYAIGNGSNSVTLGNTSVSTTVLRGNVGIGTPTPGNPLNVYTFGGPSPVGAMSVDVGTFSTPANAQASYFFRVRDMGAGGTPFYIQGNGNVGIGTTSPAFKLDLEGGQINSSGGYCINGTNCISSWPTVGANTSNTWSAVQTFSANTNFPGNGIWNASGNVGIGTTNPGQLLQVGSTYSQNPSVMIGGPDSNNSDTGNYSLLFGAYRDVESIASGIVATPTWTCCSGYPASGYAGIRLNSLGFYTEYDPASPTTYSPNMLIAASGNVGVGTTSPGARFEVNGNVKLTAGSGASVTYQDGSIQSTAWNGTTLGGDYAEAVDVLGDRAEYEPGDVIIIDSAEPGKFVKSDKAYSRLVAGVYSTKPGLLGRRTTADRPDKDAEVPMAMMGIVPTKVSTENGPIERGDLLVSSTLPGYAMKGTDGSRMIGGRNREGPGAPQRRLRDH